MLHSSLVDLRDIRGLRDSLKKSIICGKNASIGGTSHWAGWGEELHLLYVYYCALGREVVVVSERSTCCDLRFENVTQPPIC